MPTPEHERRLRRVFGPAVAPPSPEPEPAPEPPPWTGRLVIALGSVILLLAALAALGYELTPHEHVAAGCLWWTAETVGSVRPGDHGCVRGYFVAGALAESPETAAYRLSLDIPAGRTCAYRPGDAVVVRYHAVFDDGRTIIVVDGC